MADFQINGQTYRTSRLPVFTQFHIARRLAPVMAALAKAAADTGGALTPDAVLEPMAEALASMKDADVDYVLNACLSVTSRLNNSTAYSPVKVGNAIMFDDIGLPEMMQIAMQVVQDNLGNFLTAPPGGSSAK